MKFKIRTNNDDKNFKENFNSAVNEINKKIGLEIKNEIPKPKKTKYLFFLISKC